jgi:glycosyltransferase involved in cell wall biosynthesis
VKRRVLILSGMQLSANPRVVKEANALSEAGHSVEVVGGLFDGSLAERERALHESKRWDYKRLADASSHDSRDRIKWFWLRARRRISREAYARLKIENSRQLGYLAPEMLAYAVERDADLTIVHNAAALWVGTQLIRRGKRVAVDMEDWYSEDLTPEEKKHFPVDAQKAYEAEALRGAVFSTTTSSCMSDALAEAYDCQAPAVVYNSFPWSDRDTIDGLNRDRVDTTIPSICWFSQVIGPRRGLELLMDALHMVNVPCEVHLRGTVSQSYKREMLARAPEAWRDRIYFHAQVAHRELLSRIAEHDIGLASDIPHTRSRALTITNKLLFYLLAGVPVAASDTDGQREAAALAGEAVLLYSGTNAPECASVLSRLLSDPALRARARAQALEAARGIFSWERSAAVLVSGVEKALLAQVDQSLILRAYGS